MRRYSIHPIVPSWLVAALLAGCLPGIGGVGLNARKSTPLHAPPSNPPQVATLFATPAPTATAGVLAAGTAGNGAGIISNNSGNLVGRVLVPSGIVSDQGGGIIANNGGGIIANNGGGLIGNHSAGLVVRVPGAGNYSLLATQPQVPFAGAVVRLLDATGKPVLGADGQALATTADAKGAYAFNAVLPGRNLLIEVTLPADKGAVRAVVPREGAGQKVVDVDLISTLTTDYILDRYVRTQADPLATLEKLPANVELETRQQTARAVTQAGIAPTRLQLADVVSAVEDLRKHDPALDSQLVVVQKLLVVAGASDLGNGLKATEVTLKNVDDLVMLPDGTLDLLTGEDSRVWHLRGDGIIETAVGDRRPPDTSDLTGRLGTEASLDHPSHLSLDAQGRLLLSEARGLFRLEADQHLTRVSTLHALFTVGGKNGEAIAVVQEPSQDPANAAAVTGLAAPQAFGFYRCRPGVAPERFMEQLLDPNDDGTTTVALQGLAWDGGHVVYVNQRVNSGANAQLLRHDFTTQATTIEQPSTGSGSLWLDSAGRLIYTDAAGSLHGKTLFSSTPELAVPTPPQWTSHLCLAPDGRAYAAKFSAIYRLDAGGPVRVAGTDDQAATGSAATFTFEVLTGCAVTPSGDVFAIDTGKTSIYQVDAKRQITRVADTGGGNVQLLRCDPKGVRYMSDGDGLKIGSFDAVGKWTALYTVPNLITDFAIAADGSAYVVTFSTTDRQYRLLHLKDGTTTTLDTSATGVILALDANGVPFLAGHGVLRSWAGTTWNTLATDDHFNLKRAFLTGAGMCIDAKGRVYLTDLEPSRIIRFDPASKIYTNIAGPGTTHFAGSGTDDGINGPRTPTFDAAGNFYFADTANRQVKRIAASEL